MASNSLGDSRRNKLLSATGLTTGGSQDLEWTYYSSRSGLTPANKFSIADHKKAFFGTKGSTAKSLTDAEIQYYKSAGAVGKTFNEIANDFFANRAFV